MVSAACINGLKQGEYVALFLHIAVIHDALETKAKFV